MFRGIIALGLTALAVAGSATPAPAAFQITIVPQQTTLQSSEIGQPGEIGQIDVFVSSNAGPSDPADLLIATGFRLIITSNSSTSPGALTFLNLADLPGPTARFASSIDPLNDPDYVFVGGSANAATSQPLGTVVPLINPQLFVGGDGVFDINAPVQIESTPRLLARIYVQAGPLAQGDSAATFRIAFDQDPNYSLESYLLRPDFTFETSAFTTPSAEVAVVARGNDLSAVPVPPSLVLVLSGVVTASLAGWASRRFRATVAA